jgi:2-succinyl-5-enolpyruvyl-6-hydroxy-3-cyclohexene-1-carboxylate synthase
MAFRYHKGFNKNVILDERSAAFTALGIGKESGKPAILVCTSGTAAANYHPAIAEAKESGVPLIVCTADRPPSLRGVGSSQTLDQIKLFGDSVVWFHELGEPADTNQDNKRIRYAALQAKEESIRVGGASHINIPFRKPLEPSRDTVETEKKQFDLQVDQLKGGSDTSISYSSTIKLSKIVGQLINQSKKPLIIAGSADPFRQQHESTQALAKHLDAPILAEPGSGIAESENRISRFDQFLRHEETLENLTPDIILRFGDQPYSKSLLQALHHYQDVPLIRFDARDAWQDHEMNTLHRIRLQPEDQLDLSDIAGKDSSEYLRSWKSAETEAGEKLTKTLQHKTSFCDGHVFHHLSKTLNDSWNVMLSNSLPVRDAALFGAPAGELFLNRGVAGIDGIMSTANGTAISSESSTCCIIGDLAFLHDSNALLSIRHSNTPFVVVVINNSGGNIFRMLPIHEHQDVYTNYFETPQGANIEHLAKAHSLEFRRIETLKDLETLSFEDTDQFRVPTIIECVTDPDESMVLRKELWGK